jgi:hypothetical protein
VFDGTTVNNTNPSSTATGGGSDDPARQYSTMVQTEYGYPGLVQFENPFSSTTTGGGTTSMKSNSAVSLASSVVSRGYGGGDAGGTTSMTIAALPFRMVDIRVDTADVAESIDDIWDNPDDVTFQPFRIRDAVRLFLYVLSYLLEKLISFCFSTSLSSPTTTPLFFDKIQNYKTNRFTRKSVARMLPPTDI